MSGLLPETVYFWQVVATDSRGASTEGPVWSLRTGDWGLPQATLADMAFVQIPAGDFQMGRPDSSVSVAISRAFHLGQFEVTRQEFLDVMGWLPAQNFWSDTQELGRPVAGLTWLEATQYTNAQSAAIGEPSCYDDDGQPQYSPIYDCPGFRLPTEAEWEYAARAGTTLEYVHDRHDRGLGDHAVYAGSTGFNYPHEGGGKLANRWGLFDMFGNVSEWIHDGYGPLPDGPVVDPEGSASGAARLARGGWYGSPASGLRSGYREARDGEQVEGAGIRVARTVR
ncbi:MAG: formylglycine-generating enzyme family protein [Rhodothermales bacterium]|nr:formylglycine-generating enzyme family protein [Rhodothermales bacterium]